MSDVTYDHTHKVLTYARSRVNPELIRDRYTSTCKTRGGS